MAINIGNKQFEKLYKGDERITEMYKGDELIFEDFEAKYGFKFTIDTRLPNSGGAPSPSDATFSLPWFQNDSYGESPKYGKILWGDGTETVCSGSSPAIHTYPEPGVYQVTLLPTVFYDGEVKRGWLSTATAGHSYKITSIDTPFPIRSVVIYPTTGGWQAPDRWTRRRMTNHLAGLTHLESLPADVFKNVEFIYNQTDPQGRNFQELFLGLLSQCGRYSTNGVDVLTPVKRLLDRVDFSKATGLDGTFGRIFQYTKWNSSTIPSELFSIDTSRCTNFSYLFQETFAGASVPGQLVLSSRIFDLDTSSGTKFDGMFRETFSNMQPTSSFDISSRLFGEMDLSNATSASQMFNSTFYNFGRNVTSGSISEELFWGLNTAGMTNFTQMFYRTFYNLGEKIPSWPIPEKLFSKLDTSDGQTFNGMFQETFFSWGAQDNSTTSLPEELFDIDTSNGTDFSNMFSSTFNSLYRYGNVNRTVPSLFKHLDTSNGTNFSGMFAGLFYWGFYNGLHTFASDLFSALDTSSGVNFSRMFADTFNSVKFVNNVPPVGLFGIDTTNGTNFSYMFNSTFAYTNIRISNLPDGFFSLDSSNGTDFSNMFNNTFRSCPPGGNNVALPKLFDVDTSSGVNFAGMFYNLLKDVGGPYAYAGNRFVLPADLFSFLDTSNGENFSYMFASTFPTGIVSIPAGLFGALDLSSATNVTAIFEKTFCIDSTAHTSLFTAPLGDVFQGMTDFSWATAANASSVFNGMFSSVRGGGPLVTGTANSILQHFNFVPDADTDMFNNQTQLTDYATINANWK